jgi:hypothetical protein
MRLDLNRLGTGRLRRCVVGQISDGCANKLNGRSLPSISDSGSSIRYAVLRMTNFVHSFPASQKSEKEKIF